MQTFLLVAGVCVYKLRQTFVMFDRPLKFSNKNLGEG